MNKTTLTVLAFVSLAALSAFASTSAPTLAEIDVNLKRQDAAEPGKWCRKIDNVVAMAEGKAMPALVAWGNASGGCGHCVQFLNAILSDEFKAWAASRKILMCYGDGKTSDLPDEKAIKEFAQEGPNHLSLFPYVCVYWPKGNGKVVRQNFTGMIEHMPVSTEPTRAGCLIASVEKYIKGYEYIDPEGGPVSFAAVGKETLLAANGFLFAKRNETVPLVAGDDEVRRLDGTLTVALTAKNRISAKYAGASSSKVTAFTGTWATIDLKTGEVVCTLAKNGSELKLAMSKAGVMTATLAPLVPFFGETATGTSAGAPDGFCNGSYTVLLKPETASSGVGYATLTLKGAKATVKGVLPDGTTLSGSFGALADGNGVIVPIFKRMAKALFGASVAVKPSLPGSPVSSALDSVAYFCDPTGDPLTDLSVHGCEAAVKMGPAALLDAYGYDEDCSFSVDLSGVNDSDHGKPAAITPVALEAGVSKFTIVDKGGALASFSYKAANATFGGKLNITFSDAKRVSATVKGVFALGFTDGTGYIGAGTAYFKDKAGGQSVTRSVPVFIKGTRAE